MFSPQFFGSSAAGHPIHWYEVGSPNLPSWLLVGGIHGDEPEGSALVTDFLKRAEQIHKPLRTRALVVSHYNADGLKSARRTNSRGVDLNRNFPTPDWSTAHRAPRYFPGPQPASEPETQALLAFIQAQKPFLVIHCHSYQPQICYTGARSKSWAEWLGQGYPYPVTEDIGYPTPGSLGQYCDLVLHIPCLCVELPEAIAPQVAWTLVGDRLLAILTEKSPHDP